LSLVSNFLFELNLGSNPKRSTLCVVDEDQDRVLMCFKDSKDEVGDPKNG
jgi:hypothetical protein